MNIRKFVEADFPKILEIYADSKLDELRFEKNKFNLIRLENDPKRLSSIMESKIYVYEIDEIVGFGAVYQSEIRALFVSPKFRGIGVGKSILGFILTKAQLPTSLWVTCSNTPAKQLYGHFGFEETEKLIVNYNKKEVLVSKMMKLK